MDSYTRPGSFQNPSSSVTRNTSVSPGNLDENSSDSSTRTHSAHQFSTSRNVVTRYPMQNMGNAKDAGGKCKRNDQVPQPLPLDLAEAINGILDLQDQKLTAEAGSHRDTVPLWHATLTETSHEYYALTQNFRDQRQSEPVDCSALSRSVWGNKGSGSFYGENGETITW
ncbi:hypothetical protein BGW80DRAFT_1563136 [Lactifluus volemus]|nr:hypothetical protein BGW80DRAFT_1563136 [Lactifluus volemus]